MKYLVKNLKVFFRREKGMMLLIIICSFIASLIIFFSFGLIRHFTEQKRVGESETYSITIQYKELVAAKEQADPDYLEIAHSLDVLTVKELRDLISGMDEYVYSGVPALYARMTYNDDYCFVDFFEDGAMTMSNLYIVNMRFYYDPATDSYRATPNAFDVSSIVDGVGVSAEEFQNGTPKAVINVGLFNDLYVPGREMVEGFMNAEYDGEFYDVENPSVDIAGKTFEICGVSQQIGGVNIAITALDDDIKLETVNPNILTITYDDPVTHEQYTRAKNYIESEYGDRLSVKKIEFLKKNTGYYNAIIAVTAVIVLICTLNIAVIFRYILMKRQKQIAVFKLSGCSNRKIATLFVCEALLLTLPAFVIGFLLYMLVFKAPLTNMFVYLPLAYTANAVAMAFAIYILLSLIVLSIMVIRLVRCTPVTILKGN